MISVDAGSREVTRAQRPGLISNPLDRRYRNADMITK